MTERVENVAQILNEMFERTMELGLLLVNILIEDENAMWALFFHKPYARNCHSFEVVKIGTFLPPSYTTQLGIQFDGFFPSQLLKFQNCPLFVSMFSFMPFVIIGNFSNKTVSYSGLDITIVDEISKSVHLKPVYIEARDGKNRGRIFPNGTVTGAMKMVSIHEYAEQQFHL